MYEQNSMLKNSRKTHVQIYFGIFHKLLSEIPQKVQFIRKSSFQNIMFLWALEWAKL